VLNPVFEMLVADSAGLLRATPLLPPCRCHPVNHDPPFRQQQTSFVARSSETNLDIVNATADCALEPTHQTPAKVSRIGNGSGSFDSLNSITAASS